MQVTYWTCYSRAENESNQGTSICGEVRGGEIETTVRTDLNLLGYHRISGLNQSEYSTRDIRRSGRRKKRLTRSERQQNWYPEVEGVRKSEG